MKEFFSNLVRSKAFKLFIGALAAALAAYAGTGCAGLLSAAEHPSVKVLECKLAVLEPYFPDAARELVRQIDGNQAFNPVQFMFQSGLTPQEIAEVAKAYLACGRQGADEAPVSTSGVSL